MKQTVTSKYEPRSKNVTWIDVSSGSPVLKNFINGKWKPTGGGGAGSGLPTPTSKDEGKVMQVVKEKIGENVVETVIVPELTCQMEEVDEGTFCTLQNVDESFGPGFSGIAILDGIEYDVEWPEGNSSFGIIEGVGIGYIDSFELVDENHGLTHTIKVITRETEPVFEYSWKPGFITPLIIPEIVDDEIDGFFAKFDQLPQAGRIYCIPSTNKENGHYLISVYIDDIYEDIEEGTIGGTCYCISGSNVWNEINTSNTRKMYLHITHVENFYKVVVKYPNY